MYRHLDRRGFLRGLVTGATVFGVVPRALSYVGTAQGERRVALHNLHTGESLEATFWSDGGYHAAALGEINHFLRDFRTGAIHPIDTALLEQLFRVQRSLGVERPYQVISGYRSPETNAALRRAGSGVAQHSLHMEGRAIDIRLPGVKLKTLRETALAMKSGGVGYYPDSDFVHIDTGRVRFW